MVTQHHHTVCSVFSTGVLSEKTREQTLVTLRRVNSRLKVDLLHPCSSQHCQGPLVLRIHDEVGYAGCRAELPARRGDLATAGHAQLQLRSTVAPSCWAATSSVAGPTHLRFASSRAPVETRSTAIHDWISWHGWVAPRPPQRVAPPKDFLMTCLMTSASPSEKASTERLRWW